MTVQGLLLAAGEGRRMGRPKALVRGADGTPWLAAAVETLLAAGCRGVTVVLGAAADEARVLVPAVGTTVVVAGQWADGMSASLRTGLHAVGDPASDEAVEAVEAVLVSLVDLPDVTPAVCRRVLAAAPGEARRAALARATYAGRPGHPVLIGREHWSGVLDSTAGDAGARDYLATHDVVAVECGDLATGRDVDTPPAEE